MTDIYTFVSVPITLKETGGTAWETCYPIEPAPDSPVMFNDCPALGILDLLQSVDAPNGVIPTDGYPERARFYVFEVVTDGTCDLRVRINGQLKLEWIMSPFDAKGAIAEWAWELLETDDLP